jgi:hypothetical protein
MYLYFLSATWLYTFSYLWSRFQLVNSPLYYDNLCPGVVLGARRCRYLIYESDIFRKITITSTYVGGWCHRMSKYLPILIRSPDRPAHSESLYRLRYLGPFMLLRNLWNGTSPISTTQLVQRWYVSCTLLEHKTRHSMHNEKIYILYIIRCMKFQSLFCYFLVAINKWSNYKISWRFT